MTDCLKCGRCVWVHEYETYICTEELRLPFYNITTDPEDCDKFEKKEEE